MNKMNNKKLIAAWFLIFCIVMQMQSALITQNLNQFQRSNPKAASALLEDFRIEYEQGANHFNILFNYTSTTNESMFAIYINNSYYSYFNEEAVKPEENFRRNVRSFNIPLSMNELTDLDNIEFMNFTIRVDVLSRINGTSDPFEFVEEFNTEITNAVYFNALFIVTQRSYTPALPNVNFSLAFPALDFTNEIQLSAFVNNSFIESVNYSASNLTTYKNQIDFIGKKENAKIPVSVELIYLDQLIYNRSQWLNITGYNASFSFHVSDPYYQNNGYFYKINATWSPEYYRILFRTIKDNIFLDGYIFHGTSVEREYYIFEEVQFAFIFEVYLNGQLVQYTFERNVSFMNNYAYPDFNYAYLIGESNVTVSWITPQLDPIRVISYRLVHEYIDTQKKMFRTEFFYQSSTDQYQEYNVSFDCRGGQNNFTLIVSDSYFETSFSQAHIKTFKYTVHVIKPVNSTTLFTTRNKVFSSIQFYWEEVDSASRYYLQRSNTFDFAEYVNVSFVDQWSPQNLLYSFTATDTVSETGIRYYRILTVNEISESYSNIVAIEFDQNRVLPQYNVKINPCRAVGYNPMSYVPYKGGFIFYNLNLYGNGALFFDNGSSIAHIMDTPQGGIFGLYVDPRGELWGYLATFLFKFREFSIIQTICFDSAIQSIAMNSSGFMYISFENSSLNVYDWDFNLAYGFPIGIIPGKLYMPRQLLMNGTHLIVAEALGRISVFDAANNFVFAVGNLLTSLESLIMPRKWFVAQYGHLLIRGDIFGYLDAYLPDGTLVFSYGYQEEQRWPGFPTSPTAGRLISLGFLSVIDNILAMPDMAILAVSGAVSQYTGMGQVHRLELYEAPKPALLQTDKNEVFQGEAFALSWNAHTNASNYTLLMHTSPVTAQNYQDAIVIGVYSNPIEIIYSLEIIGKFYFAIRTQYRIGTPTLSNSVEITVRAPFPSAPILITKSQIARGPIMIYWQAVLYATSYTVYVSERPITEQDLGTVLVSGISSTSVLVNSSTNRTLFVAVKAFNSAGSSLSENVVIQFIIETPVSQNQTAPALEWPPVEEEEKDEVDKFFDYVDLIVSGSIFAIVAVVFKLMGPVSQKLKSKKLMEGRNK